MDDKKRKSRRLLLIVMEVALFSVGLLYTVYNLFNHFNQRPPKSAFVDNQIKSAGDSQIEWLDDLLAGDYLDRPAPTVSGGLESPGNDHPFGLKTPKPQANVE